jgi:uncharacterized spore protein YtfJ
MAGDAPSSEGVGTAISDSLGRLFGEASPATLFSEPVEQGEHVFITAVAWERAGGFGFGAGQGTGEGMESGSGEGGGGGGLSQGRPVAVIQIGPDGARVTPVIDFTKIGVTFLLAGIGVWRALSR